MKPSYRNIHASIIMHRRKHNYALVVTILSILISCLLHSTNALSPVYHPNAGSASHLFRRPTTATTTPRHPYFSYFGRHSRSSKSSSSSTARHMVLTTPENIIEEASTQNLLDDLLDESVRTSSRRPIMMQFDPSSGWIWRRWKGTVFSETWTSCVKNMAYACIVAFICKSIPNVEESLSGFSILWGQLLSVTTFTLTFFLNQSYALWRKCHEVSRRLQGRLNDLGMFAASHAKRTTLTGNPLEKSTYTPASRQVLELLSRYVRVFNLLAYASFTRSHRPILTPRGMRRLVERGLLTARERECLVDAEIPATMRHYAMLQWMIRLFVEAREAGHIAGGSGLEQQFVEKCHIIRAQNGAIGDELQGRMPLAYAHIVQVLVDVILWMYPLMAVSVGMRTYLGVLGTGLLTIFYQGLFDLAKQFIDPYDNENYGKGEDPLCVDTLIAETNAGSVRWLNGFMESPLPSQGIIDGDMKDSLLPVRGYSVEELKRREAEKLQKEQEMKEQREREEAEQAAAAAAAAAATLAAEEEAASMNVSVVETGANATALHTTTESVTLEDGEPLTTGDGQTNEATNATDSQTKVVHVVTTLEGGEPVSIKSHETEDEDDALETPEDLVTNGDASSGEVNGSPLLNGTEVNIEANGDIRVVSMPVTNGDEGAGAVMVEGQSLLDLTDNSGPGGSLDEFLAEGVTLDDFLQRMAKMKKQAEDELRETEIILNARPGAASTERDERDEEDNMDVPAETVMQAADSTGSTTPLSTPVEDQVPSDDSVVPTVMSSSAQTYANTTSRFAETVAEVVEVHTSTPTSNDGLSCGDNATADFASSSSSGDIRDDDTYEEETDSSPITLEDFSKKMTELKEKAEDELRETEAILNARPGEPSKERDAEEEEFFGAESDTSTDGESSSSTSHSDVGAGGETTAALKAVVTAAERVAAMAEQQIEEQDQHDDMLAVLDMDSDTDDTTISTVIPPSDSNNELLLEKSQISNTHDSTPDMDFSDDDNAWA